MTENPNEIPLPIGEADKHRGTEVAHLPSGWRVCSLDELADLRKKTVKPEQEPNLPYVGLEHIDSGNPLLRRHGMASEAKSNKSRFYPDALEHTV